MDHVSYSKQVSLWQGLGCSRFLVLLDLRGQEHAMPSDTLNTQWAAPRHMHGVLCAADTAHWDVAHLFRVCLVSVLPESSLDVPPQSLSVATLHGDTLEKVTDGHGLD
jgi:hypothetical protein